MKRHRTYLVDGLEMDLLRAIERRLYNEGPLTADQRRSSPLPPVA